MRLALLLIAAAFVAACDESKGGESSAASPVPAASATAPATAPTASGGGDEGGAAGRAAAVSKPRIVQRPIPFPRKRKREMAAYARRHYGIGSYRLRDPHVIVEHWTASNSFSSAYNTFAADRPDPELHELPGTCAHFVIDSDGTIYQLVPLGIMCRHTVGLNYTSFGIEHVGTSDAAVLGNRRVLRSSMRVYRRKLAAC